MNLSEALLMGHLFPAVTAAYPECLALNMNLHVIYLITKNLLELVSSRQWQEYKQCMFVTLQTQQTDFIKSSKRDLLLFSCRRNEYLPLPSVCLAALFFCITALTDVGWCSFVSLSVGKPYQFVLM